MSVDELLTDWFETAALQGAIGAGGITNLDQGPRAAGTALVKDIAAGSGASNPQVLTNVNGTLFFVANDGVNGNELWKSDGTAAGTVLVKDIYPGATGSVPLRLTNVNGALFFRANDGTNGIELWKSNGTGAGTTLVEDINPGASGSNPSYVMAFGGVGNPLLALPAIVQITVQQLGSLFGRPAAVLIAGQHGLVAGPDGFLDFGEDEEIRHGEVRYNAKRSCGK